MASFNYSTMQMTTKIVYYGPGLGGKTTNLQRIYDHTLPGSRGEMVSLETQADRTLFFDLLPLEVGTIAGFHTRIQLYTVPGQVFYNTTRKLVLKGADGIVFVADSQRSMLETNIESLRNLEANLAELGILVDTLPVFIQFNKRDLTDIFSLDELNEILNPREWPHQEASALNGVGVFETLRAISKMSLVSLKKQLEAPRLGHAARLGGSAATRGSQARRRPAAQPQADRESTAEGDASGRYELKRNLLLNLKRTDLERARSVALSLQVEDAQRQVLHQVRDYRLALPPRSTADDVLLRLLIGLNSED
jgi:signal recognition particle receptor subunit beta